jgi:hypothetical protein
MREFCTSGSVGTSGRKRPGVTRQPMLKEITRGIVIAGAAAMLFTTGACGGDEDTNTENQNQVVKCEGVNDCAGKGACAGEGHDCAGKNGCAGKGYVEITKGECDKQGGKVIEG